MFESPAKSMKYGSDEGFTRSFELVFTPVVFGLAGWGLDRWLGTGPWLAIGFTLFAALGVVLKLYYVYEHDMKVHEASASWRRRADEKHEVDLWGDGDGAAT